MARNVRSRDRPYRVTRAKPIIREHRIPTARQQALHRDRRAGRKSVVLREPAHRRSAASIRAAGEFREFALPGDSMPVGIAVGRRRRSLVHRESRQSHWPHQLVRRHCRVSRFRLPNPVPMASLSDPTAMSGSPRATPIASRALRRDGSRHRIQRRHDAG